MTTPRRSLATLLVATMLALTAAGCGVKASSDGAAVSTDTKVTTTTAAPDTTTSSTEPETTEPATTETTRPSSSTTLPGGINAQIKEQMVIGFKSLGLNDKKATCLADAYLKEFGTTASSNPDYTKILSLFSDCGIDPSEIGTGGGG